MFGHDDNSDTTATADTALDASNNNLDGTTATSPTTPLTDQTDQSTPSDLMGSTNQVPDNAPYDPDSTPSSSDSDDDKDSADSTSNTATASSDDKAKDLSNSGSQPDNDELLDLKKQSLEQLIPLVGHLDQTPEEKYRTTMMMIQATDDSSLIKDAYSAAQKISNDKTRAQALLDIVNEINYFTQVASSGDDSDSDDDKDDASN